MSALDFSFVEWDIFNKFVLKGMLFSIELTVIATVGGIVFGTLLALMLGLPLAACGFAPTEGPLLDYLEAKFRGLYRL